MPKLLSDQEVVDIQSTLRQISGELDSVTYAIHANVARVQQLSGYLELMLREMDSSLVRNGPMTCTYLTVLQRPLPSKAPVTPTGPKKPWEAGASVGSSGNGSGHSRKSSDRK